jgi:protein gp37
MSLKKSSGNMYPWITHLWNPVRGLCGFGCAYCYVRRIANRFGLKEKAPHINYQELRTNLGSGNYIFVCSGCDLFHPDIPWTFIDDVLNIARTYHGNKYLWHTKNPGRAALYFPDWQFPPESILCATIETNRKYPCMGTGPDPLERMAGLASWKKKRMVTVEPVLDHDDGRDGFARLILNTKPIQVNIGADSGHNNLPEPSREKLEELLELLAPHTRIYLKNNLRRILPESRYYESA